MPSAPSLQAGWATRDRGRQAVAELLNRGHQAGIIPDPVELEFIG